ncbi:MAG: TetR/AcrR family transcriptional regulator [Solirubrobacteraceae bacterium]
MSPKTTRRANGKLDREAVIDAALRLAGEEGLEAISFRRLADQFEVTPMALYWHFKDKEELLGSIADRLWKHAAETIDHSMQQLDPAGDDGWGQLRLTLDALVDAMREHPAVAELVPFRVMSNDAGLGITERTLTFLVERGLEPAQASDVARFMLNSAVMLVSTQPGVEIPDREQRIELQRQKRIALSSLPPDRYPLTIACSGYLTDCEFADPYFERGLELIVAGVRAQATAAPVALLGQDAERA